MRALIAIVAGTALGIASYAHGSGMTPLDGGTSVWVDNGANGIRVGAPTGLSADYSFILPTTAGSNGQVLSTDGAGATSWIGGVLTDPMTDEGDMIYRNASGLPDRVPGNTTTTPMVLTQTGDGTDSAEPAWTQINSTGYFASGAEASGSNRGVVSTGSQTLGGVKTFADGVKLDDNGAAGGGSTLNYYQEGTTSATFTFNGSGSPGNTGSLSLAWRRIGKIVTVYIPIARATAGTGSTILAAPTNTLPPEIRPQAATSLLTLVDNGGNTQTAPGYVVFKTDGSIDIYRDGDTSPWSGSPSGLAVNAAFTFITN